MNTILIVIGTVVGVLIGFKAGETHALKKINQILDEYIKDLKIDDLKDESNTDET